MQKLYSFFFSNDVRSFLSGKPCLFIFSLLFISFQGVGQATLPHTRTVWNGAEPTGWTNGGTTPRLTTFACSGSNATIFDDNGDSRILFYSGISSQLTMKLKDASMGGTSYLIIEESDDGTLGSYLEIARYGTDITAIPVPAGCADIILTLSATTRYIKWTYFKDQGNIDLDDVNIAGPPLYYRSVASGDWSSAATWESSNDNAVFVPATVAPTSNDNSINIRNGHIVTISTGVSFKATTVETGGILRLTTTAAYTIANGPGDDLVVETGGKLELNFAGTPAAISGTGVARIRTGALVEANATGSGTALGANYLATTSKFTYEHNAVFDWRIGTTQLGNNNYFKTEAPFFIPIFRFSVTPGAIAYGGVTGSTFNAKLECNATFNFQGTGSKTFTGGITGTGTVNQNAGSGPIILPTTSAVLDGTVTINILSNGLQLTAGTTIVTGANVTISGPEDGTINKVSGTFQVDGTVDVKGLNILNTGMGGVIINGTLKTTNQSGFSGTSATVISGFIQLNPGSTIEFNRADGFAQNFQSRTDFKNVRFSGSGSKIPSSGFDPDGTINITGAAIFDARGFNIGSSLTNLNMDGGRLIVSTGGQQPQIDGIFTLTGGIIEFNGASNQTIKPKNGANADIIYKNIEVSGTDVRMSNANIVLATLGNFTVKSSGVFTINDNTITGPAGSQTVVVENGGLFKTGNNEGFNGFIASFTNNSSIHQNIEAITLQSGSTVEYTRLGDQPITNLNILSYGNLTLSGSGNKIAPASLIIHGNFLVNTGNAFVHNNGMVIFGGPAIQTITTPAGLAFYDISDNNSFGLTVSSDISVVNSFSLGVVNAKLTLNGFITLLSGATKTARVAQVLTGAAITYGTGRFIVERFIPAHSKAWQLLAAPIQPGQTVRAAWQENNTPGPPPTNIKAGYGTIITGPGAGNGFDFVTATPSMKTYNPVTDTWVGIPNTTSTDISNPKGYMLFVRGDRSVQTVGGTATATIMRTTGKIYFGDAGVGGDKPAVITVPGGKFESIGNPYASAIDLTLLNRTGDVKDFFTVWDPLLGGSLGLGGFRTFSRNGSTYDITPPGGSYGATGKNIQSGQAFFVQSDNSMGGGTVIFEEADKVATSAVVTRNADFERGFAGQRLSTNLYTLISGNEIMVDGVMNQFANNYSNEIDQLDGIKMANMGEGISLFTQQKNIVVERRSHLKANDTIFYNLTQLRQQQYQLKFAPQNLQQTALKARLVDQFLNTNTQISLTDTTVVSFTVSSTSSAASNRFYLVFDRPKHSSIEITAVKNNNGNTVVNWIVKEENNISQYELQRSSNGLDFNAIHSQLPTGNNGNTISYNKEDVENIFSNRFYRIKAITPNGEFYYSEIVKVDAESSVPFFTVSPNPIIGKMLNLRIQHQPSGNYKLQLFNSRGQVAYSSSISVNANFMTKSFALDLLPGTYLLNITGPNNTQNVQKVIIR